MYKRFFKRLIDIVLSFLGLVVLAIPMLIVAIITKIDSPGPAIFKQKRIGIHKKTFTIYKFRSMSVQAPPELPTDRFENAADFMSPWQKFMRRTSIDELPQLWCIFIGTMSIVGPRPSLWNEYELIAERDKYGVHVLKPGLTGWAQINGRDAVVWERKAKLDSEYLEKISFWFDIRCFFITIFKVLRFDGVVEGGVAALQKREREILKK